MRKQASLSLSRSVFLFSVLPVFSLSPPRKSFSSENSTTREMEFMNSNAVKIFFFLIKGRQQIREIYLTRVTLVESPRGEEPITSSVSEAKK